ncbi:ABC transporter substrate-binding protein [Thalassospira australica]|uniref:ABC transporter substrate-binding protein n=1 Tax=Thalassospira australica TaxID=1528106 RepID=UPI00138E05A4|nr:ABC transporter substrate-binding protein [Thalassospira australica]
MRIATRASIFAGASCTFSALVSQPSLAETPKRIVIADGAISETALAMGIVPLAMADIPGYRAWVQEPKVPDQVINLGARFQPSMERVAQLEPDLILTSSFYANQYSKLQDLAPIEKIDIYSSSKTPFLNAIGAARKIGEVTGYPDAASKLVFETSEHIADASRSLSKARANSVLITSMLSPRHMRVFGKNSLMQDVIDQLPIRNAWAGPTNLWGFATVTIDQIAHYGDAAMIAIEPVPDNVERAIDHSPILSELPAIKRYGLITMPPVATFGGLYAAGRFARLLAHSLSNTNTGNAEPA